MPFFGFASEIWDESPTKLASSGRKYPSVYFVVLLTKAMR
jgi:hypothetical protein